MEDQLKEEAGKFNKDEKTVVIDERTNQVLDLDDILNGTSDVASRLRNLKKFGVTNEQIEQFLKIFGNMDRGDAKGDVLLELEKVFILFANKISQEPNGVVIDLNTGEIDEELSRIQCKELNLKYGEYERLPIKKKQNEFERIVKVITKSDIEAASKECNIRNTLFNNKNLKPSRGVNIWNSDQELNDDEESPEMLEMPEDLKNRRKDIIKYIKSEDPLKIKLYSIEMELDSSRGTPNYDIVYKKLNKFLEQHPELEQEAQNSRDEYGNLNLEIRGKVSRYRNNCVNLMLINKISEYSGKDVALLDESERKQLLVLSLAGVYAVKESRETKTAEVGKELAKVSWNIIKKLGPDYEKSRKTEDLFELCKKELGLEQLEKEDFRVLIKASKDMIEASFDISKYLDGRIGKSKVADQEISEYYNQKGQTLFTGKTHTLEDIDNLDFQTIIERNKNSDVLNYFTDSQIEFTDTDEQEFDEMYKECTEIAWIGNRDKALRLGYMAALNRKKELKEYIESGESKDYYEGKLKAVEAKIKSFEKDPRNKSFLHSARNIQMDENTISELKNYQDVMTKSKILKGYYTDIANEKKGVTYSNLDDNHKKAYLRNTIVGLNYGERIGNDSIVKMAQRRLELLNTEDQKFITFDENGNVQINEELILQEYSKYSTKHQFKSYEELKVFSETRKDEYMLNKLGEYVELDESEFSELESVGRDARVAEIERIKLMKNEERARKQQEQTQDDRTGMDQSESKKDNSTPQVAVNPSSYPIIYDDKKSESFNIFKVIGNFIKSKLMNRKTNEIAQEAEDVVEENSETDTPRNQNPWEESDDVKRRTDEVSAQAAKEKLEKSGTKFRNEEMQSREEK